MMVNVESESVKMEIEKLPKILQKEWSTVVSYYSNEKDTVVFEKFRKRYDDFKGASVEELLSMSDVVYTEWKYWKYQNRYETDFDSLTDILSEFKNFWQYDSEETKTMFKEMELLSNRMLQEWRLKYNFVYPHVYERDDNHYSCVQRDYHLKPKAQLWEEFKEIWDIDTSNYNEDRYKEMVDYINEIEVDDTNYFKDYPRNFFEYRENANYHSFDSYSILEQFEICEDWDKYRQNGDAESESDSDEDDE